jgi:hypothetical protein
MPFDPAGFLPPPKAPVLTPPPGRITYVPVTLGHGEPDGRPIRLHLKIEVCQRAGAPRRFGWRRTLLIVLGLLLGSALAHGQPRYEHWQDSRTGWQGQARTQEGTTDWDAYGPNGQQRHCHEYTSGNDRHMTCR